MSLVVNSSLEQELKGMKIEESASSPNCDHRVTLHGICTSCHLTVDKTEYRSFDRDKYIHMIQALSNKKRVFSQNSWIEHKKLLHLVLDLDQTVIHTVKTSELSDSDKYLAEEVESRNDLWRFNDVFHGEYLVKLRPFVHQFLKEASEMFCMSVYTKGSPEYAQFVLELIDPDKVYFGDRVVTRRESPGSKTLDLVFADKRGIVIVDDRRSAWPDHKMNLLKIVRYMFFRSNKDSCSECEKQRDESDEEGPLANVLSVLKEVHKQFFSEMLEEGLDLVDVRYLLQDIIEKIGGCGCVQWI